MDNPLEQPAPEDPIERVHAFARDLAWGAANGKWDSGFLISLHLGEETWYPRIVPREFFNGFLKNKWESLPPSCSLLLSFNYLEESGTGIMQGETYYFLTNKTFSLLEKPDKPPEIFISYRHAESSAFALLIEAHLKNKDPDISVFIDKEIQKGDDWEERIEKALRTSEIFICILGPDFARSEMMLKEIDWAAQSGSRLISILHNNLSNEENLPARLKRKKWIKVQQENAEEYEIAILKLLNTLGYPTLRSPRQLGAQ